MNEMRVASMALAAYFVSSALAQSMTMIGAPVRVNGEYSSSISSVARRILRADDDAIGLHEVLDRRALLQELRVADDAERMRGLLADDLAHLLAGADRHGALVDDDLVAVHRLGDVAGDAEHVREIGRPVLALRRADGDEDDRGSRTALVRLVVKVRRPSWRLRRTSSSRPGS